VLAFAPRISPRLVAALGRLDDDRVPIAEVNRRLGFEAWRLGLPRPSYQRVRELVHQLRRWKRRPSTTAVLLDVAFRARQLSAIADQVTGIGVPVVPRRPP
jgi:hypothetical protein